MRLRPTTQRGEIAFDFPPLEMAPCTERSSPPYRARDLHRGAQGNRLRAHVLEAGDAVLARQLFCVRGTRRWVLRRPRTLTGADPHQCRQCSPNKWAAELSRCPSGCSRLSSADKCVVHTGLGLEPKWLEAKNATRWPKV